MEVCNRLPATCLCRDQVSRWNEEVGSNQCYGRPTGSNPVGHTSILYFLVYQIKDNIYIIRLALYADSKCQSDISQTFFFKVWILWIHL